MMIAFQVADIYQVQAFRGHERQYFRLMSACRFVFLVLMGIKLLIGIGDEFSLVWLSAYSLLGLVVLSDFARCVPAGAFMTRAGGWNDEPQSLAPTPMVKIWFIRSTNRMIPISASSHVR